MRSLYQPGLFGSGIGALLLPPQPVLGRDSPSAACQRGRLWGGPGGGPVNLRRGAEALRGAAAPPCCDGRGAVAGGRSVSVARPTAATQAERISASG